MISYFNNSFTKCAIRCFILLVFCTHLLACGSGGGSSSPGNPTDTSTDPQPPPQQEPAPEQQPEPQQPTFNAQKTYRDTCAQCHGNEGQGLLGSATRLSGREYEPAVLKTHVSRMPAGNPACDGIADCVDGLTSYIFTHFATEITDPDIIAKQSCQQRGALLEPKIRRLTQNQFKNSVVSAFGDIFEESLWPALGDSIPTLGMSNNADALTIDQINIEIFFNAINLIALDAAEQITDINSCQASANTACVNSLTEKYGALLWRRPLSSAELTSFNARASTLENNEQSINFTLRSLLMSPNFLFRSELGQLAQGVRTLSHYEIASLLSYSLWDSPPDNTLYTLAANSQLHNNTIILQQVERMVDDQRFSASLTEFYKDFLKLARVETTNKVASLDFSDAKRSALLTSSELSLNAITHDAGNTMMSVFNSSDYFVNRISAPFFNLDSNNYQEDFIRTNIDTNQRRGILNHPAFLAVHAKEGGSGIVKRGVFTLKQLSCQDLGDPPDEINEVALPNDIDPAITTTRELLHLSHSSQPICYGCHQFIDPAGFGFENFDTLGRYRIIEKQNVTIDASGSLVLGQSSLNFTHSASYAQALADTKEVQDCVKRRYLEYVIGQALENNSCELTKLKARLATNDSSFSNTINAIMQLESIRLRAQ